MTYLETLPLCTAQGVKNRRVKGHPLVAFTFLRGFRVFLGFRVFGENTRAPGREPALLLLVPAAAAAAVVARQPVLARPPHERVPPEPARCRVLPPAEQRLLRSGPDTDTPSLTDGAGVQGFFRVPADL